MVPNTLDSAIWLGLPYLLKTMQLTQDDIRSLDQFLAQSLGITPLVGRINGTFEWLCPTCSGMNRTWVDNRVPHVQCCMPSCRRTFAIGLVGHAHQPDHLPPFNGLYHQVHVHVHHIQTDRGKEPIVSHYYNRMRADMAPGILQQALVRIAGTVEWTCQACSRDNLAYPDWTTGKLQCAYCPHPLWVSGALLAPGPGLRQHPADWAGLRTRTGRIAKHTMRLSRNLRLARKRTHQGDVCSAR